jgi:signal transduction histidine kinase
MLSHPFFRYSFIALFIIDLGYVFGLILVGASNFSLETFRSTLVWFVCFYWLPVWAAGATILKMREIWKQNTLLEWAIAFIFLSAGMFLTDQILLQLYSGYNGMGGFVFFGGFTWSTIIYFVCRFIESNRKATLEKNARKEAQLETLRYQLNPHFMFNSLNTISAYIHTNPYLADDVLHELSDILRYSLDTADTKLVSLQQEVTIIKKYIAIEKARFGERFNVIFHLPTDIQHINIPPLILQPIVENAVKHNAENVELAITITVTEQQGVLAIEIKDNGKGFSPNILATGFANGIGMQNLRKRVKQLDKGSLDISNDNGAVVTLRMRYDNR